MVPCRARSLYVWDLQLRQIHVLDPLYTNLKQEEQQILHYVFIDALHQELNYWKEQLFDGWDANFDSFLAKFWVNLNNEADR